MSKTVEEDSLQKDSSELSVDSSQGKKRSAVWEGFMIAVLAVCFIGFFPLLIYLDEKAHVYKDMPDEKVENVVRLFMNEPEQYTLFITQLESAELLVKTISVSDVRSDWDSSLMRGRGVKVIADVPPEKKMWALIRNINHIKTALLSSRVIWQYPITYYVEIHIHSEKDVEGAGWNHGKAGGGITQVVQ